MMISVEYICFTHKDNASAFLFKICAARMNVIFLPYTCTEIIKPESFSHSELEVNYLT